MPEKSSIRNPSSNDRAPLYYLLDRHREPIQQARALFLDTYGRERPDVLNELDKFTDDATRLRENPQFTEYFFPPDCWELSACESDSTFVDFRRHLSGWAAGFWFTKESPDGLIPVPWIMDTALWTLAHWTRTRSTDRDRWMHPDGTFSLGYLEDSTLCVFEVDGRRLNETRSQFVERVRSESRVIEEARLSTDEEEERDQNDPRFAARRISRANWTSHVDINLATIERLAVWQARPNAVLKEIDPRAIRTAGMSNASRDLTRAADYLGIARRPALTAPSSERAPKPYSASSSSRL